jgi:hypothetical protein
VGRGGLQRPAYAILMVGLLTGCSYLADTPEPKQPASLQPVAVAPVAAEPIPPPSKPVEPIVVLAPPPTAKFAAHIASYRNASDAERNWQTLVKSHGRLREIKTQFVEIDLGGQRGKVTRVLVGEFSERKLARDFCSEMRREGLFCAPHDFRQN